MTVIGRNNQAKKINHYVFTTWTVQNAWVLGLLTADGSFGKTARPQEIKFYSIDFELLEAVKDVFESDKSVFVVNNTKGRYGKKPVGMLCLSSPSIVGFLKDINAHGDKDHRNPFKHVPDEFRWAFIKGLFDGDGNVYRKMVSISGREPLITDVYDWICGQIQKKPNKLYRSNGTEKTVYFQLSVGDAYKVFRRLHNASLGSYESSKYLTWKSNYEERT